MSLEKDKEVTDELHILVTKLAETILNEFDLHGVVIKLHLGQHAVSIGLTSRQRAHRKLDDIVLGEVNAMCRYVEEKHNATEIEGETHLPQPDGTHIVVRSGEGKTGQS